MQLQKMKVLNTNARRILFMISALVLTGCGGGGGSSSASDSDKVGTGGEDQVATGVFLDSAVEGIYYSSGTISGYTDANGTFRYRAGSTITFKIGDIVIGKAKGKNVITPIDLVLGGDVNHPTVLNIVRFLMTIDDDANSDNGIKITRAMHDLATGNINFAQNAQAFSNDGSIQILVSRITTVTTAGARMSLITESEAKQHLSETLASINSGSSGGGSDQNKEGNDSCSGAYGCVYLAGELTGSYVPISVAAESGVVTWAGGNGLVGGWTILVDDLSGKRVVFNKLPSVGGGTSFSVSCGPYADVACEGLTIDGAKRKVTFSGVLLKGTAGFQTIELTIDGTLTY